MWIEIGNYMFSLWPFALLGLTFFGVARWRKAHHWPSLLVWVAFGFYVLVVVDLAFFPLPLARTMAFELREAPHWAGRMNLIPFYSRFGFGAANWAQFGQNLLLTVPMGVFLPFVLRGHISGKYFFWILLAAGIGLEWEQWHISLILGFPYRVIDITDAIANTLGVLTGFGLFRGFAWVFLRLSKSHNRPGGVMDYIEATIAGFE